MLSLLMVDEDLDIVEIALTIVAPRAFQQLVERRELALLLRHFGR